MKTTIHIHNPDKEKQLAAVRKDGYNIQFIQNPDKELQLVAVREDGSNIRYIKNPDKEVQLEAVRKDRWNIQYIYNPDKEVQLAAIKQSGWSIRFITNPDKEIQLEAVRKDGFSIQFIHNPDKEVQLAAVRQNPNILKYYPKKFDLEAKNIFQKNDEIKFPLLAKNKCNLSGIVVLFTGFNAGTVMFTNNRPDISIGEHGSFCVATDRDVWEILPPGTKIVLEQE
jgi:hypothetical protein